jgi:hypothetical protein
MIQTRPAGAVRWWMPLLMLAGSTAGLVFIGWMAGVDVQGAGRRLHANLAEIFHSSSVDFTNDAGTLRLEFDIHDRVKRATHDGRELPLGDVLIEDERVTVSSLRWEDGELMYWQLPLHWQDEMRETCCNPRWRLLTRVHPRGEGEPAGLRVARVNDRGAGGRAGLRVGDVILGVDGSRPPTSAGLAELLRHGLAERAPGGTLVLTTDREGHERAVSIELEPLVSQADWEATPGDDPVERYLDIAIPSRGGRRAVAVQDRQRR